MSEVITIEDAAQLKRLQERSLSDIWRETPQATKYQAMKNLGLAGVDFIADMIPFVSDIKAAQELVTGKRELLRDVPIPEEEKSVSRLESLINLIPALPSVGLMTKALHGAAPGRELFSMFDKKFIGTGEGGKARGWGFYFTDVRDIAADVYAKHGLEYTNYYTYKGKQYTDIRELTEDEHTQRLIAESIFKGRQIDPTNPKAGALKHLEGISGVSDTNEAREILQNITGIEKGKPGYVYNVTLHPHKEVENWLEWDAPLPQGFNREISKFKTKQPPESIQTIGEYNKWRKENPEVSEWAEDFSQKDLDKIYFAAQEPGRTGGEFYHKVSEILGSKKAASEFLDRAGVDGVRFEAGSIMGIKPKVMNKELKSLTKEQLLEIDPDSPSLKFYKDKNIVIDNLKQSEADYYYKKAKELGFIPEHYNYVIFNPEHIQINQIEDVTGKVVKSFIP